MPVKPGRRQENKAEKLRRITAAARELFGTKGFDGSTMRDIAARAGVGFGTVFDYASNKRDLLFLIFNPELDEVLDKALVNAGADAPLLDRLMALFGNYFTFYAQERSLSRLVLRELTFFSEGREAQKFVDHRRRFMDAVVMQFRLAIADGEVARHDPAMMARMVFAIFAWEVRRWLATDTTSIEHGLADLQMLLRLQLSGFK